MPPQYQQSTTPLPPPQPQPGGFGPLVDPAPLQPGQIPPPGQYPPMVPVPENMRLNPAYGHEQLAIASMILGIVSLPASILSLFSLPIPITGIVLGIVGLKNKRSFAVAGIALSVIGIILSIVVLVVGLNVEKHKQSQSSRLVSHPQQTNSDQVKGSVLSSSCYELTLPEVFSKDDISKNADCTSLVVKSDNSEDFAVDSEALPSSINDSNRDDFLKAVADETEKQLLGSQGTYQAQVKTKKFITLDGTRAYQMSGTENKGLYKYFGLIISVAPKEYMSTSGTKLKAFVIGIDSATSQDSIDKVATSWHWK
jgi:hypothetical protein